MFFGITGKAFDKYLNRVEMRKTRSLSAGSLKNMAVLSEKIPELNKVIFILDGDVEKELKTHKKKIPNMLFLPGASPPENLIYDNLKDTSEENEFWGKCEAENNTYNRQVAMELKKPPIEDAKRWYKDWYKKQSLFWGQMDNIVYKKWANDNKLECEKFIKDFFKVLKKVSKEQIPESLYEKSLKKYH